MDKSSDDESFFCDECGVQLANIIEITRGLCDRCWMRNKKDKKEGEFLCKICNKKLLGMDEIAQGICHICKAGILKKLKR